MLDDDDKNNVEELAYVDGVPELPVKEGETWGNWHSVPDLGIYMDSRIYEDMKIWGHEKMKTKRL